VNRRARELLRLARAAGWSAEVTGSGHLRFRHPHTAAFVIAPATPSDRRWRQNALAALRRALRTSEIPTSQLPRTET
jgi:predicted RNA binding protein YcfA (HicA-like mRNA interferase family)